MNYSSRDFFITSGLISLGPAGLSAFGNSAENIHSKLTREHKQEFNMHGILIGMTMYDAAAWSDEVSHREYSVANMGNAVDFPDFTGGVWQTNLPQMDIQLKRGGSTIIA